MFVWSSHLTDDLLIEMFRGLAHPPTSRSYSETRSESYATRTLQRDSIPPGMLPFPRSTSSPASSQGWSVASPHLEEPSLPSSLGVSMAIFGPCSWATGRTGTTRMCRSTSRSLPEWAMTRCWRRAGWLITSTRVQWFIQYSSFSKNGACRNQLVSSNLSFTTQVLPVPQRVRGGKSEGGGGDICRVHPGPHLRRLHTSIQRRPELEGILGSGGGEGHSQDQGDPDGDFTEAIPKDAQEGEAGPEALRAQ